MADSDLQANRVLALDQATRCSGWAIFVNNRLIEYGKIVTEDPDMGNRLTYIRKQVEKLIIENDIKEIVMEDIQLQENVQTFKALAEVFGVIYELAVSKHIPVQAILASVWKSGLNIKGKDRPAQKRNAQLWVQNNYNLKPTQDECDAICIGEYYLRNKEQVFDWSN